MQSIYYVAALPFINIVRLKKPQQNIKKRQAG